MELLHQKDKHGGDGSISSRVVEVNLSDLAAFTSEVKCPEVFRRVPLNSIFVPGNDALRHLVSLDLWHQVNTAHDRLEYDIQEVGHMLTKLERETFAIQRIIVKSSSPQPAHALGRDWTWDDCEI